MLAVFALAGCTTAGQHSATAAQSATQGASASATASATAKPSPSPQQRAIADANAIFASFAVPPGARELASPPDPGGALSQRMLDVSQPQSHVVDTGGWWEAPGAPRAVLAWEQAHVSKRFSGACCGRDTVRGAPTISFDTFSLPAILGLLYNRQLTVQAVADGKQTLIRVDAQVTWNPARPASEVVPSAARVVTLSLIPATSSERPPAPVTITDPGTVRRIIALTNGLPLYPLFPGPPNCPDFATDTPVLTFRARAGGPALAVATVLWCGGVQFTIGGKYQPTLGATGEDVTFGTEILKIAGLHWKLVGWSQ